MSITAMRSMLGRRGETCVLDLKANCGLRCEPSGTVRTSAGEDAAAVSARRVELQDGGHLAPSTSDPGPC